MDLSTDERLRITEAIQRIESRSTGEVVCVLARRSAEAGTWPVLLAAILALALPWVLMFTTSMTVLRMLSLQVAAFVLLAFIFSLPRVCMALTPRALQRAAAHRAAMAQFQLRGIARKKDRCGILIFVSLAERYARIVADDGIARRVPQSEWQGAVDMLIAHVRDGDAGAGYLAALAICEKVLTANFPRSAPSPSELPDRIFVV